MRPTLFFSARFRFWGCGGWAPAFAPLSVNVPGTHDAAKRFSAERSEAGGAVLTAGGTIGAKPSQVSHKARDITIREPLPILLPEASKSVSLVGSWPDRDSFED